jgi:hypothetical protein
VLAPRQDRGVELEEVGVVQIEPLGHRMTPRMSARSLAEAGGRRRTTEGA